MSNIVASNKAGSSALTFSADDQANLKNSLCKDLSDPEFQTFIKVCVESRLNPFTRQIYAIKRRGKAGPVVTYQTGIDGYRAIAHRTGEFEVSKTFWKKKGEPWVDFWEEDTPPAVAKCEVYKKGCREPFVAVARFAAYKVDSNPLWRTMPDNMLGKCAESLALRKAFPEDLSGLQTSEEMGQADKIQVNTIEDLNDGMVVEAIAEPQEYYTAKDHQKALAFKLMQEAGHGEPEAMSELNRLLIERPTLYSEVEIRKAISEETAGV